MKKVLGDTTITNTYDVDGIRETKTVNGVNTYTYLGEKMAREIYGSNVIDYFYDSEGRPYKFAVKEGSTTYTGYFVLNLQGNVIAIIDSDRLLFCDKFLYIYKVSGIGVY